MTAVRRERTKNPRLEPAIADLRRLDRELVVCGTERTFVASAVMPGSREPFNNQWFWDRFHKGHFFTACLSSVAAECGNLISLCRFPKNVVTILNKEPARRSWSM